ncbi:MAG TPA: translation initiation factor IF-2 [Bryobacteraceae bacterium]|nr:translation initiation factor IF-2 [Bryobacteraceae bacterium]
MNKIRINELARELEVKANEIIDRLPGLGVTEKKTHSSSIDEDVALKLRRIFGHDVPEAPAPAEDMAPAQPERPAAVVETTSVPEAALSAPEDQVPAASTEEGAAETMARPALERSIGRPVHPIRPPLAGMTPAAPPAPPTPQPAAQAAPPPAPAAMRGPQPPVAVIAPGRPIPPAVRPVPPMRPGQVLSGPRQPLPLNEPIRSSAPILTRPGIVGRAPSAPASRPGGLATPGAPSAPAPGSPMPSVPRPANRPLAGQPVARPVVPPRADLLAKLTQPRAAAPGMPAPPPPRPGTPARPQSAPAPGQPIYRGPLRPGQPMVARQGPGGAVRPGTPPRPGGPRPMHPTSRRPGMEPAVAPPPPDQQRRPGDKRGRPQRDRSILEAEEKILRPSTSRRQTPSGPPAINREITISEGITVKELSEKLDVKAGLVIRKLMDRNAPATINQTLDSKLATEIAREFGASTSTITYEEESQQQVETAEEPKDLVKRAPVVTIMGHVDHGKTSLLDAIREANVAGKEAGGITQHIGAYYVEKDGRKIVFIDTPGHEAFTRMRARGAKVTDIVVLVVAADDGVMPQTIEAIDHARAAKVPIIVAVNKIDKPDAQPERVKQQLADRGLLAEDWGGETVTVPVSAKMKINLDLLLEMILLVADLQDLKANPGRPAMGNVLEAKLDRGRGPVATVLVRNGTLHVGDYFICGAVFGKVRAMLNDRGEQIRDADPSMPVEVLGLESLPEAGDDFQVVTDTAKAKQIVLFREAKVREAAMAKSSRLTLEQLHKKLEAGEVTELPLILKADVGGSAEVLSDTLQKLSNDKVKIRVLRSGVGAINESDVLLASASDAIIIGFNVRPERNTAALAEQEKVDIRLHTIIYNLTDEIKRAMTGLLEPVYKEVYKGKAEVLETFRITKVGNVAGCMVQDGSITRDSEVRLLRDNVVVYTGKVSSLRRFKDDVSEVRSGQECGITLENFGDIKQKDIIEAFVTERVATEVFA